jgi:heme exporter protein B
MVNGFLRAAAVTRKDLVMEWRGRQTITATGMVALLMLLLLGFVLGSEPGRAAAVLWVALGFAAVVGIPRITQSEDEQQALETLLLYPGSRESLYWGKGAALLIMLSALLIALLLMLGVLFSVDVWSHLGALLGVGMLGIVGLSAIGTLLAALMLHVRGRELLMPLLLLPLALPVVLGCVRLTEASLADTTAGLWPAVLVGFDVVYLLVCPILFEIVLDEV